MNAIDKIAAVCEPERRAKIVGILERMLQLIEEWISDGNDESAVPGVGDVKQIMAIIKDMVAVMDRLPLPDGREDDSPEKYSDEELCREAERLLDIVRGGPAASVED